MTNDLQLKNDFPILNKKINGHRLVYLDNAATCQKPTSVIDGIKYFYENENGNVGRGMHELSFRSTTRYEQARKRISSYFNGSTHCLIFTHGATASINMVAQCFVRPNLQPGDEVIITQMDHHANWVPWLLLKETHGLVIRVVHVTPEGELDWDSYTQAFSSRTKLVACPHVSNVLGTINPVREITDYAHQQGVPVLVDGAQAPIHISVDLKELNCDFYAISAHKMMGPTGVGGLFVQTKHLENMHPYQGGGNMIRTVHEDGFEASSAPEKFEPGTMPYAQAIGFSMAVDYLDLVGINVIRQHDQALFEYAHQRLLSAIPEATVYGKAQNRTAIISFSMADIHPHDVATILDQKGIAIRAGHHCAMPLMTVLGVGALSRASFALYNTNDDVDAWIDGLREVRAVFV